MPNLSIQVNNISVHLDGRCLLKVPEFTLNTGHKYLITGRSGSGKTLFLKLLMGRLPTSSVSTSGCFSVSVDGKRVLDEQNYACYRRNQVVAKRLSIVFQDAINSLHPYRSIAAQMPEEVEVSELNQVFETFNLNPNYFLNPHEPRYSKQCSGGECQRLSIVSALLRPARDIFLLDEPLTDIDLISRQMIEKDICQLLLDEKRTAILVTHHINWLAGIFFQQFHLKKQTLIYQGEGQIKRRALNNHHKRILWSTHRADDLTLCFSVHREFRFQGNKDFVLFPFNHISMVPGEGLALIGESGSGKSSLLRIIADLMPNRFYGAYFEAKIQYNDHLTPVQKINRKARYGILQLVLQDTTMTLITEKSIEKSLKLIRKQKGMNKTEQDQKEFERQAKQWMEHLHLSWDDLVNNHKRIADLSLGMMRRFSLLRAFLLLDIYNEKDRSKPKLLLLDEISRGLDVESLDQVVSGLNQFCQENNTNIIAVSHDVGFVSRICNRALMVFKGEILEEFNAQLLSSKANRQKIYAKLEAPCYYERFFGDD